MNPTPETVTAVAPWVVTAVMVIIAAMGVAAGAYGLREAKEWRQRSDQQRDLYRHEVASRKDAEQRAASNAYEAQVAVRWVQLRDERAAAVKAVEHVGSLAELVESDGRDVWSTLDGVVYVPPDDPDAVSGRLIDLDNMDAEDVVDDPVDVGELTAEPVPSPPVSAAKSWRDRGAQSPSVLPSDATSAHGRVVKPGAALRAVTAPILTVEQAVEAKTLHESGVTWAELGDRFGVAASTVARAARRA